MYGGCERSSSSSGRSYMRKVGEWYGRGTGATRGALQTTSAISGEGERSLSREMAEEVSDRATESETGLDCGAQCDVRKGRLQSPVPYCFAG